MTRMPFRGPVLMASLLRLRPHRLVIAQRHRRLVPERPRLGEAQRRREMLQASDRRVAHHRPAIELRGSEFLDDVLQARHGYLAAIDEPLPNLRERRAHEPAAAFL